MQKLKLQKFASNPYNTQQYQTALPEKQPALTRVTYTQGGIYLYSKCILSKIGHWEKFSFVMLLLDSASRFIDQTMPCLGLLPLPGCPFPTISSSALFSLSSPKHLVSHYHLCWFINVQSSLYQKWQSQLPAYLFLPQAQNPFLRFSAPSANFLHLAVAKELLEKTIFHTQLMTL